MRTFSKLVLSLSWLWLCSCDAKQPCDPGQTYQQGLCLPTSAANPDAATPKPNDSGAQQTDAGDAATCAQDRDAELGSACTNNAECNCAAPFCAMMPGQATGVCTVYCNPSPDDCPSGYKCFDLSALGVSGYKPFCIASAK
jgi:hypothetical protein